MLKTIIGSCFLDSAKNNLNFCLFRELREARYEIRFLHRLLIGYEQLIMSFRHTYPRYNLLIIKFGLYRVWMKKESATCN
jgi:hypothetical protein